MVGIKDIYVKVENSTNNYRALVNAFITGLINQETHQQLAERTRLHVVEFNPNRQFLPAILSSPKTVPLKDESEMTEVEVNYKDVFNNISGFFTTEWQFS